jgi:hypothetical protein
VSWSDGNTNNPRTDANVTADITVTASFAINTYTLTYSAGNNGTISGDSPQTVDYGSNGTAVTAIPDEGYHFVQWNDGSTDNPRTDDNVTADITVTASFAINTYTLTYSAGNNGTISGSSPQTVNYGANGTAVTAIPDEGYHFVQWNDGSTDNPRTDDNVTADITITASFAINTYTLTYSAGNNGTISGNPQTVDYGSNGTAVTAIPNQGYHFVSWSDGNTDNPRTDVDVTADITATASFAINTYTLTYSAGNNGTISGSSPQTVDYGSNGTEVTAIPNQGYHFVRWSDGNTNNPRIDANVTADITVMASFSAIDTLSIDSNSITVTPESLSGARDGTIDAIASGGSEPYQYLITNATGDTIQGWSTDGNFNGLSAGNYVVHVQDANGDVATISVTVDLTTGVEDLEVVIGKLTVYPNPTSGEVNIEFKSENKDFELLVIYVTGKIILQRSYSTSEHITFDMSGQSKGIYIVQLRTNNRQINKKLIVN